MKYSWAPGKRFNIKAEKAGKELQRIRKKHGDMLRPAEVVDESRPEQAVLHPAFEWDDPRAAELYRHEQARSIIRSIRVIGGGQPDDVKPQIVYVKVEHEEQGKGYMTAAKVMKDDELKRQVIADAVALLRGAQKRIAHIRELAGVVEAMDTEIGKVEEQFDLASSYAGVGAN